MIKRLFIAVVVAIVLIGVFTQFVPLGDRRYVTDAMVRVEPFTNILFSRSFEAHVSGATPGVLRLDVSFGGTTIPGVGRPVITNAARIRIITVGRTAREAEDAANLAITRLREAVRLEYGLRGDVVMTAGPARRYSWYRDNLKPGLGRLLESKSSLDGK